MKPECSQCIRVSKKCPGYRDQLSLMFRDESTKVMQKAHAQWGVDSSENNGSPAASAFTFKSRSVPPASSPSPSSSSPTLKYERSLEWMMVSPARFPSAELAATMALPLLGSIDPTLEEQGIQFYIDRYVLAHREEPADIRALSSTNWLWHPAQREVMAAVGLAGLSNVLGRHDMMTHARFKYGAALRSASRMISEPTPIDQDVTMRTAVMLALFEVSEMVLLLISPGLDDMGPLDPRHTA